ncbi:MAG: hypothetical protein AAGG72_02780 [Pseudomonadota bacterium]
MPLTPPNDISVIKKEDKAQRVTEFIQEQLERGCRDISVFARSINSPVVLALANCADAIIDDGVLVRVVVTALDLEDIGEKPAGRSLARMHASMRIATDGRLLDAHEQMCLDAHATWIGDCLRREPAERDAFERFSVSCARTADDARFTFSKLWGRAEPAAVPGHTRDIGLAPESVAMGSQETENDLGGATAATRH